MVRWLGQRDEFRCGPIALVNILKWAGIREFEGYPVNRELAEGYMSNLCWTDRQGTFEHHLEAILYNIPGIAVQKHPRPTRWDIRGCLKSNGIMLLDTPWWDKKKRKHIWHYSLFVEVLAGGKLYYVINSIEGMSRTLVRGGKLARMLKHSKTIAYFIWKDTGWKD